MMGTDSPLLTSTTATIRTAQGSEEHRLIEIAGLAGRGDADSATQLIKFLADTSWRIRRAAADALVDSTGHEIVFRTSLEAMRSGHRNLGLLNGLLRVLDRIELDVVPALTEFLLDPDADLRIYAAQALGERADPSVLPALLRGLHDSNDNVRCQAIEALGRLRSASATDALMAIVESRDFATAFAALDSLAAIGDARVGPRLASLLEDDLLAEAAAKALGRLGDEEAVAYLTASLGAGRVPAAAVARSLAEIHERYQNCYRKGAYVAELVWRLFEPALVQQLIAAVDKALADEASFLVRVLGWLAGDAVIDALTKLLARPESAREAAEALVRKGAAAAPLVLELLSSSDRALVRLAVEILGRMGNKVAVPALVSLLAEDDLAAAAAAALAMIGDIRAYAALTPLLGHPRANVRQAAVAAINSVAHPDRAADLRRWLQDRSPLVRESAVKIACYLGAPDDVDLILACCDDENEQVRKTAIENIGLLDGDRIPGIIALALESGTPAVRAAAAQAFAGGTESESTHVLIDALRDPDVWVRYYAAKRLPAIAAPTDASLEALARVAQHDSAMQVRIAAVEGLGHGSVIPLLISLAEGAETELARAALKSLGAARQPGALPVLVAALGSEDPGKRSAAAHALGQSGSSGAVEPLCGIVREEDGELSATALDLLGRLDCPEAVAALIEFLRSPRWRETCIKVLTRTTTLRIKWVAKGLEHRDPDVRRSIVEVLARMREQVATRALRDALSDSDPAVRYAAMTALAHKGDRD